MAFANGDGVSRTSSRRSASRFFASGPWHAKQFRERIGRISRVKSIVSSATVGKEKTPTSTIPRGIRGKPAIASPRSRLGSMAPCQYLTATRPSGQAAAAPGSGAVCPKDSPSQGKTDFPLEWMLLDCQKTEKPSAANRWLSLSRPQPGSPCPSPRCTAARNPIAVDKPRGHSSR